MSGPVPEPEVPVASSRPAWIALLAGPSLWFGHFMAVYLLAEAVCAATGDLTPWLGLDPLRWTVIGLTVVVLVVIAVAARMTWTYRGPPADDVDGLLVIGIGLDALFAIGVIATAVPALVLVPC